MSIQESVEIRHVSAISVVSAIGIAILPIRHVSAVGIAILPICIAVAQVSVARVSIFQTHESVGLLADLLFHARMILKICIELRVTLQILRIVNQGWRLAKLAGNFAMVIEKLIEPRQISARDVIGLRGGSLSS